MVPEEAMKMIRGLKHLFHAVRLSELGLSSLEKSEETLERLPVRRTGWEHLQDHGITGQGGMALNGQRAG